MCSCCVVKQTAVLPQTHQQCWAVEVWEEGCVWQHQGLVPQRCRGGGVVMGSVEEGEENIACIPSHFTCISHSENGVQTTSSGGTSNVCRGLHPHMQYTCYTSH